MTHPNPASASAAAPSPPTPLQDHDSAFFWEGLRGGALKLQQCITCSKRRFPPMPSCPYCASRESEIVQTNELGAIYSWIVVHHAFHPAFKDDVPYVVATIDLEGGGRMAARVDAPDGLRFGQVVQAGYLDHGSWTELRFSTELGKSD